VRGRARVVKRSRIGPRAAGPATSAAESRTAGRGPLDPFNPGRDRTVRPSVHSTTAQAQASRRSPMSSLLPTSPLGRVVYGLAVFTFAFWALAIAMLLTWSPGRTLAATTVARLVPRQAPDAEAVAAAVADDDSGSACDQVCDSSHGYSYSYSDDNDRGDDGHGFAWALVDKDGTCYIENGNASHVRARAVNG